MALTVSAPTIDQTSASVERSRDRRADAWRARTELWSLTQLDRVRACGHHSVRQNGTVAVRVSTTLDNRRAAGFAGIATCGSVWACPVCSRKIAASRQADLQLAIERWEALGGCVAMLTLTVSHRIGQRLATVWDAVSDGWAAITQRRAWKRQSAAFGIEGWTRVTEVKVGDNGWHVHAHVVLFLHHGLGGEERARLTELLLVEWRRGIGKHGFSASRQYGVDVRMMHGRDSSKTLADYFTKGTYTPSGDAGAQTALEATRGDLKVTPGGKGSRTPFQVLHDLLTNGDVEDLETWYEWERASKGRKQMTWSKGLRDVLRLTAERTDAEIADEEVGSAADDVIVLPRETYNTVRWAGYRVLDQAEALTVGLFKHWLDGEGLVWLDPGGR